MFENTFGNFLATLMVGSMKPNEVVKMMLQPLRANCSIARSESLSGMFSRKVVASTLSPKALAAAEAALIVLIGIAEIADRPV